jgi:hypothetical protein
MRRLNMVETDDFSGSKKSFYLYQVNNEGLHLNTTDLEVIRFSHEKTTACSVGNR